MRRTQCRHPLASLRATLNLGQKEFAPLCGCSVRTIQAIELLQLPLSVGLATKIEHATGVDIGWLLAGDPDAPPVVSGETGRGLSPARLYTRLEFDDWRAKLEDPAEAEPGASVDVVPFTEVARIHAIFKSAQAQKRESLARYRIRQFEEEFKKEFGIDEDEEQDFWKKLVGLHQLEHALTAPEFASFQRAFTDEIKQLPGELAGAWLKAREQGGDPWQGELEPGLTPLLNIAAQMCERTLRERESKPPKTAHKPKGAGKATKK